MQIITFKKLLEAEVIERKNRFTVLTEKGEAHLHDPGRLLELIFPGNRILLVPRHGRRKTNWDVIAAWFKNYWVFVHSGYHNAIAEKIFPLIGLGKACKKEVKIDHSRIDFQLENGKLVEVKGCTLLKEETALFPDAPTERGRRHVEILDKYGGIVLFLVMHPNAKLVKANRERDPKFWETVMRAKNVEFLGAKFGFYVASGVGRLVYLGRVPFEKDPQIERLLF